MFRFKNPFAKEAPLSSSILNYEKLCAELLEKWQIKETPIHKFVPSQLCEACGLPKFCDGHFV